MDISNNGDDFYQYSLGEKTTDTAPTFHNEYLDEVVVRKTRKCN